ncbi:hypothetical protein LC087_14970 [Bacillus carboniphilus]|uniref:Uncharacterized protein n=1 Tax=Bacillus carboniphilus TaxID=86663 RepID=A0ABY9JUA0_9BACI|nr:hypothetical protein [Bacillus carboniphilus]WLR42058.1 hypothetical protein LC087_14970 [Bacillus carboniphilus]
MITISVSTYITLPSTVIENRQYGYLSCFQATSDQIPSVVTVFASLAKPNQGANIKAQQYDPETGEFFDVSFAGGTIVFDIDVNNELQCDFLRTTFTEPGTYEFDTLVVNKETFQQIFSTSYIVQVLPAS